MEKGLTKEAAGAASVAADVGEKAVKLGLGKMLGWAGGAGAGNALLLDHLLTNAHTGEQIPVWSTLKDLFTGEMDTERKDRLLANFLFGSAGGVGGGASWAKQDYGKAVAAILGASSASVAKDALFPVPATLASFRNNQNLGTILKAGLGLGALGLGGAALVKYLGSNNNVGEVAKARYKIQGKKGDPYSDAEVEVPINDPAFSDAMLADIGKNIRQQARKNNKYNSTKIDPKTGQPIAYEEWDQKYGNMSEEALAQLKQESGTFKNRSTDDEESSGWFGKEAAMLYLTGQFKSAGATPSNPIPSIIPPQPVQPVGPAQPPAPTTPPPAQAPQPPAPTANGAIPLSPYPPKSHGQNLTRYIQPGETPPPATGIKPSGQEDPKVLQKNMDRITRDIKNIAAKFNKGQAPATQM